MLLVALTTKDVKFFVGREERVCMWEKEYIAAMLQSLLLKNKTIESTKSGLVPTYTQGM